MTAKEYISELKSKIKVERTEDDENFLRLKYGDKYDLLKSEINNTEYINKFLLSPLLEFLDKEEKDHLSTTIVDAVPLDTIRAYGIKVNSKEYVVIFNQRLMGLISAYNEIRFVSVKSLYKANQREEKFSKNFAPLIDSYLTPNSGKALPVYTHEQLSEAESISASLLTMVGEQFILAHELSHILLGHFESSQETKLNYKYGANNKSQENEYAADIKALKWMKKVLSASEFKLPLEMCIEVFVLFHLIECNLGVPTKDNTHPSALDRLINLKNECAVYFDKKGMEFMQEMIKNCQDIESFKMI